ncbi:MAG: hypothetical protein J4F49_14275 [Rhodobacteraceae bacterium]|nr:hypothetical protein [Paracoccaceae bacterium]
MPPSKLIHVDIDPHEIGKNYETECGLVGDIKLVLEDILAGISAEQARQVRDGRAAYLDGIDRMKVEWQSVAHLNGCQRQCCGPSEPCAIPCRGMES